MRVTKKTSLQIGQVLTLVLLICVDQAIVFNIPFLRQILGFILLSFIPGYLILKLIDLKNLTNLEKILLSVGLSISFVIILGLPYNWISTVLGYNAPLSSYSILIGYNVSIIALLGLDYLLKRDPLFSELTCSVTTQDKILIAVPILFLALSIYGSYCMNYFDINFGLLLLFLAIPVYIIILCFENKTSEVVYPISIILISLSLLLILPLRLRHVMGDDTHSEFYLFASTVENMHWGVLPSIDHASLNSCLSISLIPTIYNSIINMSLELFFNLFYPLLFAIMPLIIYALSRRYMENKYSFLVAFLFMSQQGFIYAGWYARVNLAILFFGLAILAIFLKIDHRKKHLLLIMFILGCVVSHYTTSYFFVALLITSYVLQMSFKCLWHREISPLSINPIVILLFLAMLFFWGYQITQGAFHGGVTSLSAVFSDYNQLFSLESRGGIVEQAFDSSINDVPLRVKFIFNWLMVLSIFLGFAISFGAKMAEHVLPRSKLPNKFSLQILNLNGQYLFFSASCVVIILVSVVLPSFLKQYYGFNRLFFFTIVILGLFVVVFAINVGHLLRIKPIIVMLFILVPFFLCTTGIVDQVAGNKVSILINSEGPNYEYFFVHDRDVSGAQWLGKFGELNNDIIYTDDEADRWLLSLAKVTNTDDHTLIHDINFVGGCIYLKTFNRDTRQLINSEGGFTPFDFYDGRFISRNKVYSNAGSEIWR
jgi:uncharacterized membrane protein